MKIAGRTQRVHESTENQMLHGSLKPEFPMICKESIDTMVFSTTEIMLCTPMPWLTERDIGISSAKRQVVHNCFLSGYITVYFLIYLK